MADPAAPGFGPLTIANLTSNGSPLNVDFKDAITDVTVMRTMNGASQLTIRLTDPHRTILNSPNFVAHGTCLEIPDGFGNYLQFAVMRTSKTSDTLEVGLESRTINDLRTSRGILNSSDITDAGEFVQNICAQHGIPFVGPVHNPAIQPTLFSASGGTSADPNEDSWTSMQRIASTLGWRCWESAGTIFFGPDEYWYNQLYAFVQPPVNGYYNHPVPTLNEFTEAVQIIDLDWDIGAPFGDATITCMSHFWQYNPGEVVHLNNMGPASGGWLVGAMQRNFFNPTATVTLTMPMPAIQKLTPTVLPVVGGRFL